MSGTRTNSNSITSILIEKLNNKKSGFRQEMLKKWKLPSDTEFSDGTHSISGISDLGKKEPDIIGYSVDKPKVFIEVKAGINESLQKSQKKNGEYEKAAIANNIDLIFIIPDGYEHKMDIPENANISFWSKIYACAKEFDNTGFTKQIEDFVENDFGELDNIFTKIDVLNFLNPNKIGMVLTEYKKLKEFIDNLVNANFIKKYEIDGFGFIFSYEKYEIELKVWVGMYSLGKNTKDFLFIYLDDYWLGKKYTIKQNNIKDFYIERDGSWYAYYFPIRNGKELVKNVDKNFNKLLVQNLDKIFSYIQKK